MAIDYSRWNPINLILAPLLGSTTTLVGLLVNRVREQFPIMMEELILLVILLSFYLFLFIYRQLYYPNNEKVVTQQRVKL